MADELRFVVGFEMTSAADAIDCIQSDPQEAQTKTFERFEIGVRYANGNAITGRFKDRASAIAFLREYQAT